ncbi:MAG TPA: peptidylprolyl isomerase [Acidimicrobiales bacterium]|nr:peptidylprolyl isomerase [Acidimicrobiales bacterium]
MGTDKRERKKANRAAKIAEQEAAEAKARRIKAIRNVVLFGVGIVIVAVLLSLTACGADTDTDDAAGNRPDTTDTTATTTGASSPADPDGDETGDPAYGDGECPPVEGVDEPVIDFTIAPQLCIDPARSYMATFATTLGEFTVELDTERTPLTTNNFVVLARFGYFDGTDLFRTEAASGIIQGGSPHTQSNTDPGPGYTIPDEALPFSADDYAPGTLAMARTAAPDSGSAQFFLLANEGGRYLGDPESLGSGAGTYVVFGRTTEGLDVLQAIAELDDGTGVPSSSVSIDSVTITES